MVRLESLCELRCDTIIDSSYFYGLSQFCKYIQRLLIVSMNPKPNHGIIKLIEVQKKLKHFEWVDNFDDDYTDYDYDPYEELLLALEKKAESLNYLKIVFFYLCNYEHTLFQDMLPKFDKLKVLIIDDYISFDEKQLEKLKLHELEVLNIERNKINVISSIIENSGRRLKKVLFDPNNIKYEPFNFNEEILKEFLEKWNGRHAITLFTTENLGENYIYKELTNKYKRDGVIKDFKYLPYVDLTEYITEICF
ncbi:hypothetical protein GLOIN_2v1764020 [Rhizophagus irregularis DAOM 181602=DAOM 197198]|nr:hypothetical protein GLOIN_2v1764020 [Rhizophagus irregularis DAOM 181602=DAOM 197198]